MTPTVEEQIADVRRASLANAIKTCARTLVVELRAEGADDEEICNAVDAYAAVVAAEVCREFKLQPDTMAGLALDFAKRAILACVQRRTPSMPRRPLTLIP